MFALCLLAVTAGYVCAQEIKLKIPATSTGQRIEQDFGLGVISVQYYRPNTKGRKIFDGMEPYGIVWRTGANNATIVKLTDTITVEGHTLAPGAYSLFSIPGAGEWTIIFNKNAAQWGAYAYDEKQDLARVDLKKEATAAPVDQFTMAVAKGTAGGGEIKFMWENTQYSAAFAVAK